MGRENESPDTVLINAPQSALRGIALTPSTEVRPVGRWVAPEPGSKLAAGRFEVLERLGEGGMGIVYSAFDAQRRTKVALKTLHRLEAAGIYQLKSEFRMLAGVSHPNLVRLHELFADDQTWFFSMDLVEGQRFDEWFRKIRERAGAEPLEGDEPAWVGPLRDALAQLVDAVLAIHRTGKLHRDLKPSNVMVDREGRLVVLDFGLAMVHDGGTRARQEVDTELSGTPAYMAPEQALGLGVTAASDWYALGVMLFEALTGRLPFRGTFNDILVAKQLQNAPPVTSLSPGAPADLSELCAKLLSTEPTERPASEVLTGEFGASRFSGMRMPSRPPQYHGDLVGREAELDKLDRAYEASVSSGKPVIALLKGESGIGKSTLVARFLDRLSETTPAVVLRGRCYERETVPFRAFDAAVDDLSRFLKALRRSEARALLPREAWALVRLFPVLERVPALAGLAAREGAEPHEIRRRGFVAFGELLSRVCERAPLVLYIDDLQWSDADSVALLMHLLRQADAPHLLFVASCRDGVCPVLEPLYEKLPNDIRISFREIDVEPLPVELALQVVGGDAPEAVLREARGNPFLLRELARHARASGAPGTLARSLNEVLWQRCASLPESAQRLLHAIVLSASPVPLEVAVSAAGVQPSANDALEDLQLVRRGVRETEVECYHDKIREAVAHALSDSETRAMHRCLAEAWQATAQPDPEVLSTHFERGGDAQRAAALCIEAARRAASAFGFERAVALYSRALELGTFDGDTIHRLRVARADMLAQAGRSLEAAESCLNSIADASSSETAELTLRAGGFYLQCGRIEEAIPLVNRGLNPLGLSVAKTNAAAVASLMWERSLLRLRGYEPRVAPPDPRAAECFRATEVISAALPSLDPIRYPPLATRLLRLALDSGDPVLVARGMASEVLVGLMLALPEARLRKIATQAKKHCKESGDPIAQFWLDVNLAILELNDNPRASLEHLDRAREMLTLHPSPALSQIGVWLEWNRLQVLCLQGAFSDVAKSTPALLDDAWASDNRGVVPFLAGVPGAVARVAVEDLVGLRHDLDRSKDAWQKETFTWQDIMQTQGEVALCAYEGSMGRALAATQLLESKLSRSLARRAASVRGYVGYVSTWTSLARARELTSGTERSSLLERAAASLRFCDSKRLAASWSAPLEAALEALGGNPEAAVRSLRSVLTDAEACERLPVYAVCAKRGLGALLAGDEGALLVAEADDFLRQHGVVDPERFVGAVAPGLAGA